jgi:SWIB/MDM2 domain
MVFHCTSPTRSRPGRRFYGRRFIRERGRGQFLQTCGAKALQKRFGHRKSADGRHYWRPLHQSLCWIDRQQEFRRKGTRIAALCDVYTDFHFCSNSPTQHIMPIAKSARKPNAALMKPVQPDDTLAKIVGSTPLPRSEVTKKVWDYIRKNKLQDAKKKTLINADDALKAVFGGKKQVTMFEMTKHVSGHMK